MKREGGWIQIFLKIVKNKAPQGRGISEYRAGVIGNGMFLA
jgi:hypothetical protein